jgi:coenzyme F420-reducing hydrogenase alpha subunit
MPARAAIGMSCTEAPRGLLYHRYRLDENGLILDAKIVPPTSQNQRMMEDDLREIVSRYVHLPQKELIWRCEQTIRNYDPCISCATHLVKMDAN